MRSFLLMCATLLGLALPRGRIRSFSFGMMALAAMSVGFLELPARPAPSQITLDPTFQRDPAVELATKELAATLNLRGSTKGPLKFIEQWRSHERQLRVVAGDPSDPGVKDLTWKYDVDVPSLSQEGYVIQPLPQHQPPTVVVIAEGPLGLAYGLMALAEDILLQRPYLSYPLPLVREPAMSLRLVADPLEPGYPGAEQALKWGYNAVMIEPWPSLALYEQYNPAIYEASTYGQQRAWVEEQRRKAREEITRAKALHLKVIAPGDVISFPKQMMNLYGARMSDGAAPPRYCIERDAVREALSAGLDEVLREFPEIDGIMVRTGENYELGPLAGNTPQSSTCTRSDGLEKLAATVRLLDETVTQKHGRLLIQRAWDLGSDGAHAQPNNTKRLASVVGTPAQPLLSYKVTQTDFWRYNPLNPNFAHTVGPRMVEFQAAREFEGKGAFPNYIGGIYAGGAPESPEPGGLRAASGWGVDAAWVWPKGGGWDGPQITSSLWLDANNYALSRLLWDPQQDPKALAYNWAAQRFGAAAAPGITALLELSPQAALKGMYIQCYATKQDAWSPNNLWVRDDIITGDYRLNDIYQACKQEPDFSAAIAEKQEAVALVDEMLAEYWRVEAAIPDRALARETLVSLYYQRSLFESLQHYLSGMFYYYRFMESSGGDRPYKEKALAEFTSLEQSWRDHTQVAASMPGAPTPFRDAGMWASVRLAQAELGQR